LSCLQSGFAQTRQGSTGVSEVRFLSQDDFVVSTNSQGHLFVWQITDANEGSKRKPTNKRESKRDKEEDQEVIIVNNNNKTEKKMPKTSTTKSPPHHQHHAVVDKSTRLRFTDEI